MANGRTPWCRCVGVSDLAVRGAPNVTTNARWWVRPVGLWVVWRLVSFLAFLAAGGKPVVGAARWDDGYYLTILRQGYRPFADYGPYQQTNFFPLLSWATRAVQVVVRSETVAVHTVVSAASLAAAVTVFAVARRSYDDKTATIAIVLLLAAPGSIFLWLFFTEGLFIALSAGAILAAQSGRDRLGAVLGIAVAMTRPLGVLIIVPLVLARLERRRVDRRTVIAFAPIVGLMIVMGAQWRQAGDPLAFQRVSALWGRHTTLPLSPIVERLQEIFVLETYNAVALADVASVVVVLWLCAASLRTRLSWCMRSWLIAMAIVPLISGLSHSWSRYMMAAWPAAIVGAAKLRSRPHATWVVIAIACALLNASVVVAWHNGLFVG
jgi:hypothetical protein